MEFDAFNNGISGAWHEHKEQIKNIFKYTQGRTRAVHEHFSSLQTALSRASGERIEYKWGPARYDIENGTVKIPYYLSCPETDQHFSIDVIYFPHSSAVAGKDVMIDDLNGLLVPLTEAVWAAFQPPKTRRQPIYAPPGGGRNE